MLLCFELFVAIVNQYSSLLTVVDLINNDGFIEWKSDGLYTFSSISLIFTRKSLLKY